jgi:hypothetical protein
MERFLLRFKYLISRVLSTIFSLILFLIKKLFGLLEFFLFLRFSLKFFGANPKTLVVNYIYKGSEILVSPFNSIFPNVYWKGRLIDTTTISAMVGYAILVFLIFQILKIFSKE